MADTNYRHIYLSPHLDDAALSCGGTIYLQRQGGLPVLAVTLMAGDAPPEALDGPTPILADLHARWELDTNPNPVAARRAEDQEALSILKADALHWEVPECVYRRNPQDGRFLYPTEASLWDLVHPSEQSLVARLAQRLAELPLAPEGQVYVPLTVGGHVDHHLVRQAAERWGAPEGELVYYEEYPYTENQTALKAALQDSDGWQAESVPLDTAALDAKAAAVACYHSQISTFFANTKEIATRLRTYAAVVGGGQGWAERYWRRN